MATAIPQKYEHLERWAFGDTEQQADEVVQLILNGTKTATCSNLDGEGIPQAGDLFWWWTVKVNRSARLN